MHLFVIRYAEIALKGGNRHWFENLLVKNIKDHLKALGGEYRVKKIHGRMIVEAEGDEAQLTEVLRHIPGIQNFSLARSLDHDLERIKAVAKEMVGLALEGTQGEVPFRVDARRSFKGFPLKSQEINMEVGGALLPEFDRLKVELKNPELSLGIEIWERNRSILFLTKEQGQGGLPIGSSGNVFSFLSGGIDSPVSSWMMMNRGCKMIYITFHSFPFTSEQSKQKVIDLVEQLSRYQTRSTLLVVPFANIQRAIKKDCQEKDRTILYRRFMFLIANALKEKYRIKAYVTGEAVGQVASQTLENIACTEDAADLPVLRPLIGMEKAQIMTLAKRIGTYPISIQPYDDCCTVFQPRKPETHAKVEAIRQESSLVDQEALIQEAVEGIEIFDFTTKITQKFF